MAKRKGISAATKRAVIERAGGRCEKCHLPKPLDLHHIVAYSDGGEGSETNLAALCDRCHTEHHALEQFVAIPFAQWLTIPPLGILIGMLCRPDMWPEDVSAQEFHRRTLAVYPQIADAYALMIEQSDDA